MYHPQRRRGNAKTSGAHKITLTLRPSGMPINVITWLVDNEYFDANVSRFLDAFPVLKEGFSPDESYSWRGAMGAVKLKQDDRGFLAFDRYIPAEKAEKLPEFVWTAKENEPQEMPEYTGMADFCELSDEEGIPF